MFTSWQVADNWKQHHSSKAGVSLGLGNRLIEYKFVLGCHELYDVFIISMKLKIQTILNMDSNIIIGLTKKRYTYVQFNVMAKRRLALYTKCATFECSVSRQSFLVCVWGYSDPGNNQHCFYSGQNTTTTVFSNISSRSLLRWPIRIQYFRYR